MAASITGFTREEAMGKNLVEVYITEEFRASVKEVLDNALQGREAANFEFPLFTKDQARVEVLLNATTRRDVSGHVVGVIGVGQDVTERKQVELEMTRVAKELQTFIDTANAPIFGIDSSGLVNEWNNMAAQITGFPKAEVMGKNLVEVYITEQFREAVKEVLDSALQGNEAANFEFPLFTKDQKRVEVLLNATTRRDVAGNVVGVIGVGQDITERKEAEEEKTRVAQELQTFIATANAPIFGIDENGLVNEWNNKAAEITGYTRVEVMGQNLVQVYITQEYRATVKEVLDNALMGREAANFEFPLFTKDQKRVEVLLNATTRRDVSGNVVGVIGVGQDVTERKLAELEMTRVAKELQTFIDTANAPIFGIDSKGLVNEWNNKAAEITGFPKAEVMGQSLVDVYISEDYRASVKEVLDNALMGNEAANFEFPLFTKDQKRVEVLLNATTRRDVTGKVIGVIGVGQDVTERKQAELEMTRVAKELQTFIDTANAPIFGIDANGLVNEWNNMAAEITGFTRTEVMGQNLVEVYITEEFRASVKGVLDNALQGREAANFEFPLFTKDQRRVEVLLNATTRRDVSGYAIGVIGVGQDITERKHAEQEKTRVAQELQNFIDSANAPIFGIDAKGLVNEWNNKAAEITGFTRDEVMGQNLVEVYITEEFRASVKEVLDNALQGYEAANFEFPLFTKDQKRVEVLLNATSRRDVTGLVIGVIGVGQDITERKKAEQEKSRVAKELQNFIDTANAPIFGIDAAGLVNEWNNMAASITGFTRKEVMGKNLVEVYITEEFRASVKEVLDNALMGNEAANFEFPLFTKDQKRVEVLLNATTRRDVSGNVVGVIGVGQDVTERKLAELEMTRVAKELQSFIDTANAPIFGIDSKGLVNEWNNMAAQITGFPKAEVMGKNLVEVYITRGYRPSVKQVLDNALMGIEAANFEFPLFTKDQKRVDVLLNATTRRDVSGNVVGVIGVGQDVTERKVAELEMTRVAKELQTFIDTANAPIFGIDSSGLVNEWNNKAAQITGFPKAEVMGKSLVDVFITEEYRASVKEVLDNALSGNEAANFEFPLFTKDQKRVDVLLNATTRRDVSGNVVGVIGVGQDVTERKLAELEMTRVAKELQTFIDTANAPIFGIDSSGLVNEWNNMAAQITGFTRTEVMGKNLVEVYITEEFRASVKGVLDNALQGNEAANFEFPLFTKDQRRVEVLLNATTRKDVNGSVVGVIGVGQDITERKQAEQEASRVAQELQTFIDTANAPIFGIDARGRVNEWNNKAAEITGFSSADVVGRDLVQDFITKEFRASVKEVLENALQGQEAANFEFPLYTIEQRRVDVLLNATTRKDVNGNIVGVIGVGQDITERKQAEQEKTRVAQELQTFIDTANAPIFGIDSKGLVNEWNNKAAEITGFTRDEVMGKNLVQAYITGEYRASVKEVLDNALQGNEAANFEFPLFTKSQKRVDVLLNATTRRDVSGNVVGVIGVGQDVTERKQAELEMTRVAQELQTFIDTANAPIFGIDSRGFVNEWNNKAAEITGFPKAEVMGKSLVDVYISEDYRASVKEVLDNALMGSEAANFEFPLFTKDQKRVEVLLNATTRRDVSGNVVGVIGVGQDVTERKVAELEMTRVAKELQTFIDTANAPIFGIDSKGLVNEWNNMAAQITGFPKAEVMGKNLVEVYITEEFRASVKGVLDNALQGKEAANFEFPLFTKDQRRVEVLLNATTRKDVNGSVVGVIGVGQDITKRKEAELEMTRVAKELQTFIDTANAPIFGIDSSGLVNEWNNMAAQITGYPKAEVMGKNLVEVYITEEYRASVKEVLDNALLGNEAANFEFPLFTKDQKRVEVLLNATTRRDVSGNVVGVIGVGQDVTERKLAELEMTRVAKELQTFIDTANAPIFGIDSSGLVNEWNNKAAEITGFPKAEVMGKNLVEVYITEEFRASVKEVLDDALMGSEAANFEFPLFTKSQKRVEVLLNATTRRDVSGNVVGVIGVGQDVTERKVAELEMTRVAKELQTFIDTANAPIFGIDASGLVNEWNNMAAQITGFTRTEVMGKNLVEVYITEEFRASVKGVLDNALQGNEAANFEFPLFTKDQRRVEVLLNATTRKDVNGSVVGVIGVGQDITMRKEAELEMTRVAQELQTFIDTANAPIFGIDSSGLVNEWNNKAAQITGFPKAEVMGQSLVDVYISEDYRASVKEVLDNALLGNEAANFEFPLFTKDQKRVEVLLNATTRRDVSGNVVGVIGVGQDVTERKLAELEMTRVAKELQTFIDTANAPIFGIDSSGLVNEWNNKAAEITGFPKAEVMGKNLVEVYITEEYRASVKEVLDDALMGSEAANFEFPLFTKDQKRVEVLLNATTRRDVSGNVVGVIGVGQDVTERKVAELEMTRVAKELQTFIDTANAPIFGIDSKGLVNEWNNMAAQITGFPKAEVIGKNLVEVYITEEFRASVKGVLDNALQGKEAANFEFPLFTKDQRRVEVLLNATTRKDVNGSVVGVIGVGQDITERKEAELEMTRVAKELQTFIDTANAPIFGIDSSGLVNEWNNKAAEITGFTKAR
jgi:PAS domain S-box-containing protein